MFDAIKKPTNLRLLAKNNLSLYFNNCAPSTLTFIGPTPSSLDK